jgi:Na+/H+ antiporter NhaD/arsenite permease-like protein
VLFRNSFQFNPEKVANVTALQEQRAITNPALLVRCMIVIAGFCLHAVLHVAPSIVALVGAG